MAMLAVKKLPISRNLDTLACAYYLEGQGERALQLLQKALDLIDLDDEEVAHWAVVQYHRLSVLIDLGRVDDASAVLAALEEKAPNVRWTEKARRLSPLLLYARPTTKESVEAPRRRGVQSFEYDVAISFAGEDSGYAQNLAADLQSHGVRVFYDDFEKAELWGKDLYTYLTDIYQNKARYCIILISESYARKRWTNLERRAAQARAFASDKEYILPVRLDTTVLPGMLPTVSYLDWNKESLDGVVDCTLAKLGRR